jgi:hypothetical protein
MSQRQVRRGPAEDLTAAEAAACTALVLEGVASGEILASEGAALSATISAYIKVLEATEIEARISALEARENLRF